MISTQMWKAHQFNPSTAQQKIMAAQQKTLAMIMQGTVCEMNEL